MPPYTDVDNEYQIPTISVHYLNEYHIRPMTELDIERVVQIDQDTWKDHAWSANNFFDALRDPMSNCWIFETTTINRSIIGYGLQHMSDDISHITNITLHSNQCGRGLGGFLLDHMIDHARQYGASTVELQVHIWNIRAFNLYIKRGFAIIDYLEQYYEDKTDAHLMQLQL